VPRAKQEETAFWNQKWGKTWSLGSCYPFSALMEYQACDSRPVEKILHQNKVLIHSRVKTARYTTCYTPMVLHTEQSHSKKHYQLIISILLSTNIAA
jgi:hypothetical protein